MHRPRSGVTICLADDQTSASSTLPDLSAEVGWSLVNNGEAHDTHGVNCSLLGQLGDAGRLCTSRPPSSLEQLLSMEAVVEKASDPLFAVWGVPSPPR